MLLYWESSFRNVGNDLRIYLTLMVMVTNSWWPWPTHGPTHSHGGGEDDRCLHVAVPIRHSLQMSTKPVTTRATTATRAECVRHGMGHNTPFSERGSRNAAEDDPRPNILQLNTEGPTANKISVIEQLAYKNKAFIIVLHDTHCTTADKLVQWWRTCYGPSA